MSNHNLLSSTVKALQPRSLKYLSTSLQGLIRGKLWLQVLVGMFLGIVVGILMGPSLGWVSPADATTISDWLALPGKLATRRLTETRPGPDKLPPPGFACAACGPDMTSVPAAAWSSRA